MITEIGHFALALSLFVAIYQALVPLVGAYRGDVRWMAVAKPAAVLQFLLIGVAFAALTYAYITSDFSVYNVALNSHSEKPLIYKITGVWGNHEGSLLLWILILSLFGAGVAVFGRGLPPSLRARVLSIQAMVAVGFISFILFTSNPFHRLFPAPIDGNGLNPVLQDMGLALHPPFLYLGYVGFSIAFSFAIAALIEGRVDPAWARYVRPWTLAAWIFLTLGNGLGSWWAYYELGWGGWWFWDPVENASFIPWLSGTALLHSAIVVEKRNALKSWTILLAIVTFSMSLLGTFLVRSGVLTSVHAFASDPQRGVFILVLLLITVGGSLTLYAMRASTLKADGLFAPISREGGLVLNNLILSAASGTVLLGTLYPLFVDVLGDEKISVGAPFFNATFVPMMVPLIAVMAIGPMLSWKRADLGGVLARMKVVAILSGLMALFIWSIASEGSFWAAVGAAVAVWLLLGTVVDYAERIKLFRTSPVDSFRRALRTPRSVYGMVLAHAGMAIVIAGITGSSYWQEEKIQSMQLGEKVDIAGYSMLLKTVNNLEGSNYSMTRATFVVLRDGKEVMRLYPENRIYRVSSRPTTEAAIESTLFSDLYAVIGDRDDQGGWVTRFYHKPMVLWLWIGGLMMALGGLVSLADRRFRLGIPLAKRRQSTVTAQPQEV